MGLHLWGILLVIRWSLVPISSNHTNLCGLSSHLLAILLSFLLNIGLVSHNLVNQRDLSLLLQGDLLGDGRHKLVLGGLLLGYYEPVVVDIGLLYESRVSEEPEPFFLKFAGLYEDKFGGLRVVDAEVGASLGEGRVERDP